MNRGGEKKFKRRTFPDNDVEKKAFIKLLIVKTGSCGHWPRLLLGDKLKLQLVDNHLLLRGEERTKLPPRHTTSKTGVWV